MTKRKFTPPTEFPAEYENGFGDKITLLAKGIGEYPYTGQDGNSDWHNYGADGSFYATGGQSKDDLHDIPKKQVHWANDYAGVVPVRWWKSRKEADRGAALRRIAVVRREWVEGELPQYFTEEV
jgi:hypothetical protein